MKLNIPFCTRKPSFVGRALVETGKTDLVRRYVLALAQELAANGEEFSDCRVEAVRLGGGTASIMGGEDFDRLCRLIRELGEEANDPEMVYVRPAEDAAAFLVSREGRILLTTGAKEVEVFSGIARERLYVRVLPMTESLMACERAGIPHRNVIAMYGPFSQEMNEAIFRQFQIAWLVTKDAGTAGGFQEKVAAALALGVRTVVIRRPVESGASMEEILREVRRLTSLRHEDPGVCTGI